MQYPCRDTVNMKLSNKQKESVEKITGKPYRCFSDETLKEYFNYTDRGIPPKNTLNELILAHRQHPIIIELWKQDFKSGVLLLWDFLREEYPNPYIKHAIDIYKSVFGYIPECYRTHPLFIKE